MKKIIVLLLIGLSPMILKAQNPNGNYNPYVDRGAISPSPLNLLENGGKGEISFDLGNKGVDPLRVYSDHYMILTITLSNGVSELEDPLSVISGSYAGYFSWTYNSGTYTGIQLLDIPAESSGDIKIAFKVSKNSPSPGSNGFNVNITPSPYHTASNIEGDDAFSTYTYTEEITLIGDIETSPLSIFPNPSKGEVLLSMEGEIGSYMLEVVSANGSILRNKVLNLQGVPVSLELNDLSPGLYHINLTHGEQTYTEKLIITD